MKNIFKRFEPGKVNTNLFSSPVPDEDEEEDPWEDKTAEITFGGPTGPHVNKVPNLLFLPVPRYLIDAFSAAFDSSIH